MVIITLQRDKCIGCNYCAEFAPEYFHMSKKDGKSVLLKSADKKGFFTLKTPIPDAYEPCEKSSKSLSSENYIGKGNLKCLKKKIYVKIYGFEKDLVER